MKPSTVLVAIVFGSATAISFGLCGTWVIFWLLNSDHPQMVNDMPKLGKSCLQFLLLAAVSGLTLFGIFKERRWRTLAATGTWGVIALLAWAYWPKD